MSSDLQMVESMLRYFDADGDGRLLQSEFARLWSMTSAGKQLPQAQYAAACKQASVKPKDGLDRDALFRLYSAKFADLDAHFAVFQRARQLPEDGRLRTKLAKMAKASCCPERVDRIAHLQDGTCVILSHKPHLYLFEDSKLKSLGAEPEWMRASTAPELLIRGDDGKFKAVEIVRKAAKAAKASCFGDKTSSKKDEPRIKVSRSFGSFPKEWGDLEEEDDDNIWDACLCKDGLLHIAAVISEPKEKSIFLLDEYEEEGDREPAKGRKDNSDEEEEEPPLVVSQGREQKRLFVSRNGNTFEICQVPPTARLISISNDGQWCAYAVLLAEVVEEAMRGEWYICRLQEGAAPCKISEGPIGRIAEFPPRFSPSAGSVVYQANHNDTHPITRHMDLWLVKIKEGGNVSSPVKITPGSMQVNTYDWSQGREDALWLSTTDGHLLSSFILDLSTQQLQKVEPPAAFECVPSWNPCTGKCVYPVESATEFEGLWDEESACVIALPEWSQEFEDIHAEILQWAGPGGEMVSGAVYHSSTVSGDKPLIVWVHGGPTCAWPVLRGNFSNEFRFGEPNFTVIIRAGYLLFVPLYRGTLGFGDAWSMATIGHQGSQRGDLGDILSGVAHLQQNRLFGCGIGAGILGESYGGYMAIKAMSDPEGAKVFQCAASMYGYVMNREVTLLTGDFTWEDEFFLPQKRSGEWPAPVRAEDCFDSLGNVQGPLLLLHGDEDDVCPLSHSQMVYQALRQRGVPTELLIYPGQGHGFSGEKVEQDYIWRILQWFLKYLPAGKTSA
ncbi:unnamed protein product [Polarella glacialis]|uniref:EF-hand domain-containing protein n=1 Tax=Polarella glacialis TaxID=89957 RepID=A0A813M2R5_POLGL|nr:unnamed protein product [Polarella glacialis]